MHYYDVQGVARILSDVPLRELERFEVNRAPVAKQQQLDFDHDIRVQYKPGLHHPPRLDRRVMGKGNPSLSYVEQPGSFGATVKFSGKQKINVDISWLLKHSNAVLYVNVVEPLLRMVLADRGYALLHGACLSRRDRAVLVSAPPDTGKTSTVLRCLDKQWFSFMADDMTIVGPDLSVYNFPKPFTISSHTYAALVKEDLREKGFVKKVKLIIKSRVHSKTGRRILRQIASLPVPILTLNAIGQILIRPPKIFVEDLVKNATVQSKSQATIVCLLRKGPDAVIKARPDQALKELLANSDDAFGFPPYSNIFQHMIIRGKHCNDLLEKEKQVLTKLVNTVPCYWLYSNNHRWDLLLNELVDTLQKPMPSITPPESIPFEFNRESLLQHYTS